MVIDKKKVVVIDVPEFEVEPIICKKDAHSKDNPGVQVLKAGQIFIRTGKATTEAIKSVEDMRDLLRRATTKDGDDLLNKIKLLIKGKPLKVTEESIEKYEKEIEEAKSFFDETIGGKYSKYGYWQVVSYPSVYLPKRISDKREIRKSIESLQVRLRGWYFPQIGKNASFFKNGWKLYSIRNHNVEGYTAYKSGLFVWKGYFREDFENDKPTELSFIHVIYSIKEFLLFIKRYYEKLNLNDDDDLVIEISLHGTENRLAFSRDSQFGIGNDYYTDEGLVESELEVKMIELKTSYEEIVKKFIKDIFLEFKWDIDDELVDDWQSKLPDR